MAITFLEPGSDATGDLSFFSATSGTPSSSTTQAHTGPRSIALATGNPAVTQGVQRSGVLADAGRRLTFWLYADALPNATTTLLDIITTGGTACWRIRITSAGVLTLNNGANGLLATGSGSVTAARWVRIALSFTVSSTTVNEFRAWIDGTLSLTATDVTISATAADRLVLNIGSGAGVDHTFYFDDIYIDDSAALTDPGDIRVTAKRPLSNGATNTFDTTAGSGSGYGSGNAIYVNDVPVSGTNGLRHANDATTASENFVIEGKAVGDVDVSRKSIIGRRAWVRASGVSTDTIMDNGTAAVPPTAFSGSMATIGATPVTGSAEAQVWPTNTTSFPAIGMGRPTANATDATMQDCGVIFAYLDDTPARMRTFMTAFNVGTGAAGTKIQLPDFGFTAKAIMVWTTGQTGAIDAVGRSDHVRGFGYAVSAASRAYICGHSADASANAQTDKVQGVDAILRTQVDAGTTDGKLDVDSFDESTITPIVDDQFAVDVRVHLHAWGGDDLKNVAITTHALPNGTGNESFTGVGFAPDFGILGSTCDNTIEGTVGNQDRLVIGFMARDGSQGVWNGASNDTAANMNTRSYCTDAECFSREAFGPSMTTRCSLVSLDADGFTWNQVENANNGENFAVLWFKGGSWTVKPIATLTDTTTPIVISGLGFKPSGGMVVSRGGVESTVDSPDDDDRLSLGAFVSASLRGTQSMHDADATADSTVSTGVSHDQVYQRLASTGMVGEMDVQSMDAAGVTFIMDDADPDTAFCLVPLWGARPSMVPRRETTRFRNRRAA